MFAEYLDSFREYAEERMDESSRVIIRRPTGRTAQDDSTGREVPIWAVVHSDLPVRFPVRLGNSASSRTLEIAGVEMTVAVRQMDMAYETENVADGDLAEVTDGRAAGTVWRIVDATPPPDQATAFRVDVIAVDRPEEWP